MSKEQAFDFMTEYLRFQKEQYLLKNEEREIKAENRKKIVVFKEIALYE